jgi:hypothetical protein
VPLRRYRLSGLILFRTPRCYAALLLRLERGGGGRELQIDKPDHGRCLKFRIYLQYLLEASCFAN